VLFVWKQGKIEVQPDQVLPPNKDAALQHGHIRRDLAGKLPGFKGLVESVRFFATNRPVAAMAMPIIRKQYTASKNGTPKNPLSHRTGKEANYDLPKRSW